MPATQYYSCQTICHIKIYTNIFFFFAFFTGSVAVKQGEEAGEPRENAGYTVLQGRLTARWCSKQCATLDSEAGPWLEAAQQTAVWCTAYTRDWRMAASGPGERDTHYHWAGTTVCTLPLRACPGWSMLFGTDLWRIRESLSGPGQPKFFLRQAAGRDISPACRDRWPVNRDVWSP